MTNVGLIGAGGISKLHLSVYQNHPEKVHLTGVCDAAEERARKIASEFNIDYWTDYEVFLKEADVDAVDIALPHISPIQWLRPRSKRASTFWLRSRLPRPSRTALTSSRPPKV